MTEEAASITLSLISHTNVGKTTLARTLLRRDIGEVRDQPHVTDVSEAHTLLETASGRTMTLWDTPGFGDTARLLKRLKGSKNPITWIISQTWDRFRDRPLWCSQQAVRNVQADADLVLYLVNAAEDPSGATYVDLEMEILEHIGKPVILLLNQTGPPRSVAEENAEIERWKTHIAQFGVVKDVLNLDAFARCWVQEAILLDKIGDLLPEGKKGVFGEVRSTWLEQNLDIFVKSMDVLCDQLAAAACSRVTLQRKSWGDRLRSFVSYSHELKRGGFSPKEQAMAELASQLDTTIRRSMNQLIELHGLEGSAAEEIFERIRSHFAAKEPVDEGVAALLGGFVSGALTGLAADMLAGGLTFFGGAVAGGILGATGAASAVKGYNMVRGAKEPTLAWTDEFLTGFVRSALLRYLAVAHFGRGRGEWTRSEAPGFWQDEVAAVVDQRQDALCVIWASATPANRNEIARKLRPLVESSTRVLLTRLTGVDSVFPK